MYSTRIGIVAITTTAVKAGQFVWNRPRNWASPSGSVQWLRSWRSTSGQEKLFQAPWNWRIATAATAGVAR